MTNEGSKIVYESQGIHKKYLLLIRQSICKLHFWPVLYNCRFLSTLITWLLVVGNRQTRDLKLSTSPKESIKNTLLLIRQSISKLLAADFFQTLITWLSVVGNGQMRGLKLSTSPKESIKNTVLLIRQSTIKLHFWPFSKCAQKIYVTLLK